MSTTNDSPVHFAPGDDPEMMAAYEAARATFRYFWRELSWERRRIIPGLDLSSVKAPFHDGEGAPSPGDPTVEHMWLGQVDFDGKEVSGTLLNSPNWLKTVQGGDRVHVPLTHVSDWMYSQLGAVCGGHTVNLLRSRMSEAERRSHDDAWGLDFGDPRAISVVPPPAAPKKSGGFLAGLFGKRPATPPPPSDPDDEHPMSVNMAPQLREQITKDPSLLEYADERGWTFLHSEALAGNVLMVEALLSSGADKNALTSHQMTAAQLAETLGWSKVVALF